MSSFPADLRLGQPTIVRLPRREVDGRAERWVRLEPRDSANWLGFAKATKGITSDKWSERSELQERATAAAYMAYHRAGSRQAFLEEFVSRMEFVGNFPQGLAASIYVDRLFLNEGVTPTASERTAAINAYGSGNTLGRAAALKSVIDSDTVFDKKYNPLSCSCNTLAICAAKLTILPTITSAATTSGWPR